MKKLHVYFTLFVALFLVASVSANAQGKYGKDSAECVGHLNFYKDYLKQNNIPEAASQWRGALKFCPPKASQNFYLDGRKIYKSLIAKSGGNAALRESLIDTLMMIHKTRMENFPKSVKASKENIAYDMLQYYKQSAPEKVIAAIEDVVALTGSKTKTNLLVPYMEVAGDMFKEGKMEAEKIMQSYNAYLTILNDQYAANPNDKLKEDIAHFEGFFINSGVASCDNLLAIYTPKYEADPSNKDVLGTIVKLLGSDEECLKSELFLNALTSLHQIEPSYTSSYFLFKLNASKDNAQEAVKFLEEAIASEESDNVKDAEHYMELAAYNFKNGNHAKAVAAAKAAVEKDAASQGGKANILMANIWAGQKCTANDMDNRAKYWVAVDFCNKAKQLDASVAEEANNLIAQYRQYFPKTEDAFMYDLTDGKSYSISCGGMSATTTVRTQK